MSNKVLTYAGLSYYDSKIKQYINAHSGGGTPLYKHEIQVRDTQHNVIFNFVVYCSRSNSFTSIFQLGQYANDNTYIAWCNGSQSGLAVFNISDGIYIYYTTFSGNYSIDENYIYDAVVQL